jgi:regulator of sigma E protease
VIYLLALLAAGALIVVHELGHYIAARLLGLRIERCSVGYGRPLWRRTGASGTTYQIGVVPVGGYVHVRGVHVAGDRPAGWRRPVTLLGGSLASYLAAGALAFALFVSQGIPGPVRYYAVDTTLDGYDAHHKLAPGDRILAIDGEPIVFGTGPTLAELVNKHHGDPVVLALRRGGVRREVTVIPRPGPEGRVVLGIRPREDSDRMTDPAGAIVPALAWPADQVRFQVTSWWHIIVGADQADVGGPVRVVEEIRAAYAPYAWLRFLMMFSVWALLAQLALDLGSVIARPRLGDSAAG